MVAQGNQDVGNGAHSQVAITSLVTASVLDEFKFLKFSFELFHGEDYRWFVRCDRLSYEALSHYPNVVCKVFADHIIERPDEKRQEFRDIVAEKMNVIADAWCGGGWTGVVFFDADVIITAPIMGVISRLEEEVVLTPNYYPTTTEHLAAVHGYFNSGFVFTRHTRFHEWWQNAFRSQPWKWTDQTCLNEAHEHFSVGTLSERANVGFWRYPNMLWYEAIPPNCEFLHVHLFQPLRTQRQWINKSFALHCLKFLRQSTMAEHKRLFSEALARDESRWYEASLWLS